MLNKLKKDLIRLENFRDRPKGIHLNRNLDSIKLDFLITQSKPLIVPLIIRRPKYFKIKSSINSNRKTKGSNHYLHKKRSSNLLTTKLLANHSQDYNKCTSKNLTKYKTVYKTLT